MKIDFAGGTSESLLALVNGKVDAGEINSQQQATGDGGPSVRRVQVPA